VKKVATNLTKNSSQGFHLLHEIKKQAFSYECSSSFQTVMVKLLTAYSSLMITFPDQSLQGRLNIRCDFAATQTFFK